MSVLDLTLILLDFVLPLSPHLRSSYLLVGHTPCSIASSHRDFGVDSATTVQCSSCGDPGRARCCRSRVSVQEGPRIGEGRSVGNVHTASECSAHIRELGWVVEVVGRSQCRMVVLSWWSSEVLRRGSPAGSAGTYRGCLHISRDHDPSQLLPYDSLETDSKCNGAR